MTDPLPPPPPPPSASLPHTPQGSTTSPDAPRAPLAIGSILGRTFSIWVRSLPVVTAFSLLVFAPLIAWARWFTSTERGWEQERNFLVAVWGISGVLSALVSGGLARGVLARLGGREVSPAFGLSSALTRLLPVLGVTVLTWIYAFFAGLGMGVTSRPILTFVRSGVLEDVFAVLTLLVMLLVTTTFHVAVPVVVLERPGARMAMERSAFLTSGNRLRLFGLTLLFTGLGTGATWAAGALLSGSLSTVVLGFIGVTALVLAPLGAISGAVAYHDLRRSREGTPVEDLGAVFE